jgi:hypothetical protein
MHDSQENLAETCFESRKRDARGSTRGDRRSSANRGIMIGIRKASFVLVCVFVVSFASARPASEHDKEFWRAIARDQYKLPEGESALALMRELSACLGSPDPELRDELAYAISAQWIYRQRLFDRDALIELVAKWSSNLKVGIGKTGDDTVLLRSFSALDLSIAAALDNDQPFLTPEEHQELLANALGYLAAERDLRDFEHARGWLHATAHTADLLKFLARSRHFVPADQSRVLTGISEKLAHTGAVVFTHGEDDRLARAVLSIVLRTDFDGAAFGEWMARLRAARREAREAQEFDSDRYAEQQNTSNLLRSLYVLLSCVETSTAGVLKARSDVLAYLCELG